MQYTDVMYPTYGSINYVTTITLLASGTTPKRIMHHVKHKYFNVHNFKVQMLVLTINMYC